VFQVGCSSFTSSADVWRPCVNTRYLLKPHNVPWESGILAIEAGSGFGALKAILSSKYSPHRRLNPFFDLDYGKPENLAPASDVAAKILSHVT